MDYFHLQLDDENIRQISTLGLAHIGDGVYELMVRSWLVVHGKLTNKGLHRATIHYVSAQAQAHRGSFSSTSRSSLSRCWSEPLDAQALQ